MTLRRLAPLLISALLLAALLLIHYSRVLDWNWTRTTDGGSLSPAPPVGDKNDDTLPTDIYVTVSLDGSRFARLTRLNDKFMAKYPRIRVHLYNDQPRQPEFPDWLAASERGEAPDIMLLDNNMVLPLAVRGHLKSVDSLMAGDALSDQLTGLLEPLRWNGYLWGVPSDIDPYLLFWNEDMLAELGIQSPISDIEALDEAAKSLAGSPEDEAYVLNLSPGDLHQLMVWEAKFHQGKQPFIALQGMEESDRDHLLWLDGYAGRIARIPLAQSFKLGELLLEDKLLSAVMTWSAYNKLNTSVKEKLTLDAEGIAYPWLNGRSYVIAAGSRFEGDAMLWIQEMTDADNNYASYEASDELPVRASLYGERAQSVFRSGLRPPVWWYEALSAKPPEGENVLADPAWPLRWQQWESDWRLASGEEGFRIADYLATVPDAN